MGSERTVLGVDLGTTSMKMGVFVARGANLSLVAEANRGYPINVYNGGLFGDIEQEKWKAAFAAGCREL
ncbi:MAG TPA: hypothetical protein VMX75_12560, partial [Spirochaetia bacterium]|nr:hypothetical protein [Spirochaetia bacterium]